MTAEITSALVLYAAEDHRESLYVFWLGIPAEYTEQNHVGGPGSSRRNFLRPQPADQIPELQTAQRVYGDPSTLPPWSYHDAAAMTGLQRASTEQTSFTERCSKVGRANL